MVEQTVIVVGPGGVGKGPLDFLFKPDIIKIDPYRLRSDGPRDASDVLYGNPKLRDEFRLIFAELGDTVRQIDTMEWYPKSKALFFKVRKEWQLLLFVGLKGRFAKLEIYAPVLPLLLSDSDIRNSLGRMEIIVLNPASESIIQMPNWETLENETRHNCEERGDSSASIQKRVASISDEAPAWKNLILANGATEYMNWQYAEYRYKRPDAGASVVEHQKNLLIKVRDCLVEKNPNLDIFFKAEHELNQLSAPFVK